MNINDILFRLDISQNMVWQITDVPEFRQILTPLIRTAREKEKRVVYIRFSKYSLFPEDMDEITQIKIPLTHRFESFTIETYNTILNNEEDTLYIFDCLSDLQTAWATDLMMGNFFRVITPVILQKKSSACYPLIRGKHSLNAYEEIRQHTQCFLELYSDFKNLYMRPKKLDPHTSGDLFMPHIFKKEDGRFEPILDGVLNSRFRKALSAGMHNGRDPFSDSWDRFFDKVQRDFENGEDITKSCNQMCNIMMSRDERIRKMIRDNFNPEDFFFVKEHMIGTGLIGGKACGMLTARKIIENKCPGIYYKMEPHDSFFVGSDVFYTYIVENGFWDIRVNQRKEEGYFTLADEFAEKLKTGVFSEKLEEEFIRVLEYYGQSPIIVRSSSILEDGFGNAFAGKYESVFCGGNGSIEERLEEFENAIRVVYASTLSRSALDYRVRRNLNHRDEQMALLVQRVSGSYYGDYYMPCAAGVGYSFSTYRFLESLDPKAGLLRLVMGLGTSAVDRTEGSYPRLVSLDKPEVTAFTSQDEHHRYSQQNVELIDKNTGELKQMPFSMLDEVLPEYLKKILYDHDFDAQMRLSQRGIYRDVFFVTCSGLVKNQELMTDMKELMAAIQKEYEQAVDIEFTINLADDGEYVINLLQCRPLQAFRDKNKTMIPETIPEENIFIDCQHSSMGFSQEVSLDAIVYVDPIAYYNMPYNDKMLVARTIGVINWHYRNQGKELLLLVPGRIGTSSPELGVPTTFADISEFSAIFEIAESRAGYSPELSYGSHIFQDLVENEILYMAIFEDQRTKCFRPELFTSLENSIEKIDANAETLKDIIGFYDVSNQNCKLYHDLGTEHLLCTIEQATCPGEIKEKERID